MLPDNDQELSAAHTLHVESGKPTGVEQFANGRIIPRNLSGVKSDLENVHKYKHKKQVF